MDTRLNYAGGEQPRGQWVCHVGSICEERDDQKYAENGHTLDAVSMCSGEPLQERRQIGIVWPKLVRRDGIRQNQP